VKASALPDQATVSRLGHHILSGVAPSDKQEGPDGGCGPLHGPALWPCAGSRLSERRPEGKAPLGLPGRQAPWLPGHYTTLRQGGRPREPPNWACISSRKGEEPEVPAGWGHGILFDKSIERRRVGRSTGEDRLTWNCRRDRGGSTASPRTPTSEGVSANVCHPYPGDGQGEVCCWPFAAVQLNWAAGGKTCWPSRSWRRGSKIINHWVLPTKTGQQTGKSPIRPRRVMGEQFVRRKMRRLTSIYHGPGEDGGKGAEGRLLKALLTQRGRWANLDDKHGTAKIEFGRTSVRPIEARPRCSGISSRR